ncbi:MAG: hypothetical protein ACK55W_03585 [Pseudomonadota bacterium]
MLAAGFSTMTCHGACTAQAEAVAAGWLAAPATGTTIPTNTKALRSARLNSVRFMGLTGTVSVS